MVYYLGRDVKVYLTTESPEAQVSVVNNEVTATGAAGGGAVAASGRIAFSAGDVPEAGDTITIISADATSKTYTFVASAAEDASLLRVHASNTATTTVDSLNNAIVHTNGHGTKFTVTQIAAGLTLNLVNTKLGASGNTTMTKTLATNAQVAFTQFASGADAEAFDASTVFAEDLDSSPTALTNLTGVDLGIGVTDEDITYIGARTVLKAEIKKETTITLTRKKTNNIWDVVYNGPTATNEGYSGTAQETGDYGARWGVHELHGDNSWKINNGLMEPKAALDTAGTYCTFGYRVFVELNGTTDTTFAIPGCQLVGHTVTLNADGTTEETCELISQCDPIIKNSKDLGATGAHRLTAADM